MFNEIDAGNICYLTVDFTDRFGLPSTPTAVYVTVTGKRPAAAIRAETALTGLGATMDIVITALENQLIDPTSGSEIRHVKARAVYGTGGTDQFVTTYEYRVRNPA